MNNNNEFQQSAGRHYKMNTTNIVWLRNDLRIEDNPALYHAALASQQSSNSTCCAVYIMTPKQWQLHDDAPIKIQLWRNRLIELQQELQALDIPLQLVSCPSYTEVPNTLLDFAIEYKAKSLYLNYEYPLNEQQRDSNVCKLLEAKNIRTHGYHGDVVMPPGTIKTQQKATYKVFTPFSRKWHRQVSEHELALTPTPAKCLKAETSTTMNIGEIWDSTMPSISMQKTSTAHSATAPQLREDLWPTDTKTIHQRADQFCIHKVAQYKECRDIPSIAGTSTLSPYLAMGAISPRQCINKVRNNIPHWRENQWVTELIWREFYRHLIEHYPHLSRSENFIYMSGHLQWENDDDLFTAWREGETGYPIVDAAMKQLTQTGWMHNRLRMIVAAFLTKLLLIDWRKGEQFFMEHLIDGDYASNNGGWQWAASTGADAAPYFRIFSPERQSQRFDTEGVFIKKFIPELEPLDKKSIHTPSTEQRLQCGYKEPIIDYKFARQRALDRFAYAMGKSTPK